MAIRGASLSATSIMNKAGSGASAIAKQAGAEASKQAGVALAQILKDLDAADKKKKLYDTLMLESPTQEINQINAIDGTTGGIEDILSMSLIS